MRRFSIVLFVLVFAGGMTACHSKPDDKTISKDIQSKIAADPETREPSLPRVVPVHAAAASAAGRVNTRSPF